MAKKLRVANLFGGKSAEHEISLISARNIVEAIDRTKYEIVSIGIDKDGRWFFDQDARLLNGRATTQVQTRRAGDFTAVVPGASRAPMIRVSPGRALGDVDVVFPILHGPFGEDG